jgi:hypothetical protein
LDDTLPPVFNNAGKEFLVVTDCSSELRYYRFPSGPLIGKMKWPFKGKHDHFFGDSVSFVGDNRALVSSGYSGKLYLVDLEEMKITEEILVRGPESNQLYSNFVSADPSRREFISVGRPNHLLTWRMPPSM